MTKILPKAEPADKASEANKAEEFGKVLFGEDGHTGDSVGLLDWRLAVQRAEHANGSSHCRCHDCCSRAGIHSFVQIGE